MANWYDRHILPKIIGCGCGCRLLGEQRARVVPLAERRVLEIGVGGGANLIHYDPVRVTDLQAIDPAPELLRYAEAAPRSPHLNLHLRQTSGEALPFEDGRFDTVVCTFTLCTVADPDAVLREARRVLAPGGAFLFCEHGAAPDRAVARWQQRVEPLWKRLMGGCHLTRPATGLIARHFRIDWQDARYLPRTPRIAGWNEWGRAIAI